LSNTWSLSRFSPGHGLPVAGCSACVHAGHQQDLARLKVDIRFTAQVFDEVSRYLDKRRLDSHRQIVEVTDVLRPQTGRNGFAHMIGEAAREGLPDRQTTRARREHKAAGRDLLQPRQ